MSATPATPVRNPIHIDVRAAAATALQERDRADAPPPPRGPNPRPCRRVAFLGNHVPRQCGIATFTSDLVEAVARQRPGADVLVAAMNDRGRAYDYPDAVRIEIEEHDRDSYAAAADRLDREGVEAVCVQHEFGIFGGEAGAWVLDLIRRVHAPVVTTMHTVLRDPEPHYRATTEQIIQASERIVVMTRRAVEFLVETYGAPRAKIDVIPHGIPDVPFLPPGISQARLGLMGRDVLLTFGLLGPGKGIEHVIRALPAIVERHPRVLYVVLGATHPNLVRAEGDTYRRSLQRLAADLGVKSNIAFEDRFVAIDELTRYLCAADVYLTPYPHVEQICSGTLAYAVGCGNAVVSTPYWHAEELLADDRGVLVPIADPPAIAAAVTGLLAEPERREALRLRAYARGREMTWDRVALRYWESLEHARASARDERHATVAAT